MEMEPVKIVEKCSERLPQEMRQRPWAFTNHGRKVLESEDELDAYLAAYGEIHIVKCRAALQNFPFENLKNYSYEVFDWGCGQGIATLTLLEMLEERGLLGRLKRITLIEPSFAALDRAEKWTKRFAGPGVEVRAVNSCIPSSEYESMGEVCCQNQVAINLFSNILDIRTISLKWLAQKTASLAVVNYMVCVGPKFGKGINTRMDDFCGYFAPDSYFSSISLYPYAYTQKTHHAFGCETRCFVHKRDKALDAAYKECSNQPDKVPDDYDLVSEFVSDIKDKTLVDAYNKIREACEGKYRIYLQPKVSSDVPDILMSSRTNGIVLVGVCSNREELDRQFERMKNIKTEMFATHLKTIKVDSISESSVFNCVKIALYVPGETVTELKECFKAKSGESNDKRKGVSKNIDKAWDFVVPLTDDRASIERLNRLYSKNFKAEYHDELVKIIEGSWHSYREGNLNFKLSRRQKQIVDNENDRIRIKGVAGSGKTQIVANRAVKQQLLTGERVLIITYNVSLIQYIKMRINQVPADFPRNMFEVVNYHQFFKSKANLYSDESLTLSDWDDSHFFEKCKERIERYKTIIIDEVQDFKTAWLYGIITYFLAPGGSISVFGDGEQNIYNRKMEPETKMPVVPTFSGAWGKFNERISMRIMNPEIARLASSFAHSFISEEMEPVAIQDDLFGEFHLKYWRRQEDQPAELLAKSVDWIISHYGLDARDVVVLAESINLLRDVADCYKTEFKREVMATFESKGQFDALRGKYSGSYILGKNLQEIRRAMKTHFTTDCDDVKMSTIHSFKGWESKSVILLLQKENNMQQKIKVGDYGILERENMPALIYTALTRAKSNLFIINLGNEKYDEFFKNNIKNATPAQGQ